MAGREPEGPYGPRGVTESYVYDGLGRLTGVYDNEGNKV